MLVEWLGPELLSYLLGKTLGGLFKGDRVAKAMRTVITDAIRLTADDVCPDQPSRATLRGLLSRPRRQANPVTGAVVPVARSADHHTLSAAIAWWVELVDVAESAGSPTAFENLGVDATAVRERLEFHIRDGIAQNGQPGAPLAGLHDRLVAADRHTEHLDALRGIVDRLERRSAPDWGSDELFALPVLPRLSGRESDLASLLHRVEQHRPDAGRPLVIVIHGMPGVGKTSLAIALAAQLSPRTSADVPFIELQGWTTRSDGSPETPASPDTVLGELLVACGLAGTDLVTSTPMRSAMWRAEVARHAFPAMVLDNARSTAQIAPLLPNDGGCVVVVTSRTRLTDLDCVEHRVAPLADHDTIRLLTATRPEPDARSVAQLVELTGGLPLANDIVLAALRRHEDLPMSHVARELAAVWSHRDDSSPLRAAATPVWAAFDLSYRQLSEPERRALCLLSRQPGRAITAFSLASLLDVSEPRAGLLLSELAAANLIERRQGNHWRFHDLIAAYVADRSQSDLTDRDRTEALNRLVERQAAAAELSAVTGSEPIGEATPVASAEPARRWLITERENLVATLTTLVGDAEPEMLARLGRIAIAIGPELWRLGYTDDAQTCHSLSLDIARRSRDRAGEAAAELGLGYVARMWDRYHEAEEHLQRANHLYTEVGNASGEAESLTELGHIARLREHYDVATDRFNRALEQHRRLHDGRGEVACLAGLGEVAVQLNRLSDARGHYESALMHSEAVDDLAGTAESRWGLGEVARAEGDTATAEEHYRRALDLHRQSGHRLGEADTLRGLGDIARMDGRLDRARELLELAVSVHRAIHDRVGEADGLHSLGWVHAEAGRDPLAIKTWSQAVTIYRDIGSAKEHRSQAAITELSHDGP